MRSRVLWLLCLVAGLIAIGSAAANKFHYRFEIALGTAALVSAATALIGAPTWGRAAESAVDVIQNLKVQHIQTVKLQASISPLPQIRVLWIPPKVSRPPKLAELLLRLAPVSYHEALVGDLEQAFQEEWVPKFGIRLACLMYWWHVGISIGPLLWGKIRRLAGAWFLWKTIR